MCFTLHSKLLHYVFHSTGQFWNINTTVSKFDGDLSGGNRDKAYTITIPQTNATKEFRVVGAFRENIQWDRTQQSCLYVGNWQGGYYLEFEKTTMDHLIEGSYTDYIVKLRFATNFRYERFNGDKCLN